MHALTRATAAPAALVLATLAACSGGSTPAPTTAPTATSTLLPWVVYTSGSPWPLQSFTSGGNPGTTAAPPTPTSSAACLAPPSGLVGWWPADGHARDVAGGNDGTFTGGDAYAAGAVREAFDFGSGGRHVVVADDPSLDVTASLTLMAWILPRQAGSGLGTTFVLLKGDNYARHTQSYGFVWTPTGISFRLGSPGDIADLTTSVPLGQLAHVAGTYDGTTATVYVDGVPVASGPVSLGPLQDTAYPLIIGSSLRSGSVQEYFDGLVDEVNVYDRALTASEVAAIAAAGSLGMCAP